MDRTNPKHDRREVPLRRRMRERLQLVGRLSEFPELTVHAQMRSALRHVTSNFRLIAARMQALGFPGEEEPELLDEAEPPFFPKVAGSRS